jgi:hypothetical protein
LQLDIGLIGFMYQGELCQIALSFGLFLGKNVTLEGMLPLDLTSSSKLESLFCTGNGLHFWHYFFI